MIELKTHTILMMVGPSHCGKDHYIHNVLLPGLRGWTDKVHVLSSDDIRRELLDEQYHKHDPRMVPPSAQAFELLETKLKLLTQYPINAHFVIVNTTGLEKDFRINVIKIANDNHYNIVPVVFNYDKGEFFKFTDKTDSYALDITRKHVAGIAAAVNQLKSKKTENYDSIVEFRKREDTEQPIKVVDAIEYDSRILDSAFDYYIIGDVHGCLAELKTLLATILWERENVKIILVGDIVDKGPDSAGVVRFIHSRPDKFILTKGNHENRVYKRLKGLMSLGTDDPEWESHHFRAIKEFLEPQNADARDMFFELVEKSKEFYIHDRFVVTHAPCKNKYLTKMSNKALKKQVSISYPKRSDYESEEDWRAATRAALEFFQMTSKAHVPHFWGHMPVSDVLKFRNQFGIDTGCVMGGKLTAAHVDKNMQVEFYSVPSSRRSSDFMPKPEEMLP